MEIRKLQIPTSWPVAYRFCTHMHRCFNVEANAEKLVQIVGHLQSAKRVSVRNVQEPQHRVPKAPTIQVD